MEALTRKQEATINAKLVGVLPGDPPKINLATHATGRNGSKRHFTRQVSILDDKLFTRLKQEASVGDCLRVTVIGEYHETGSSSYLVDFKQAPDIETMPSSKNGSVNITTSDVTQINIRSTKTMKAEVKH